MSPKFTLETSSSVESGTFKEGWVGLRDGSEGQRFSSPAGAQRHTCGKQRQDNTGKLTGLV